MIHRAWAILFAVLAYILGYWNGMGWKLIYIGPPDDAVQAMIRIILK
jgi:hypothetical protein